VERDDAIAIMDDHASAVAAFERLLAGVAPDRLEAATPCPEWDVRALIDHVAGLHRNAASAAGEPVTPNATETETDPIRAFAAAAAAAQAALRRPDALARSYQMPWGAIPGALLVRLLLADTVIHTWDLARATDQDTGVDPALCESVLTWGRTMMRPEFRTPQAGFGPEVAVPANTAACDRLAAFYGRQP
jgi:uncharacterized protein (TIGR03086 family)